MDAALRPWRPGAAPNASRTMTAPQGYNAIASSACHARRRTGVPSEPVPWAPCAGPPRTAGRGRWFVWRRARPAPHPAGALTAWRAGRCRKCLGWATASGAARATATVRPDSRATPRNTSANAAPTATASRAGTAPRAAATRAPGCADARRTVRVALAAPTGAADCAARVLAVRPAVMVCAARPTAAPGTSRCHARTGRGARRTPRATPTVGAPACRGLRPSGAAGHLARGTTLSVDSRSGGVFHRRSARLAVLVVAAPVTAAAGCAVARRVKRAAVGSVGRARACLGVTVLASYPGAVSTTVAARHAPARRG